MSHRIEVRLEIEDAAGWANLTISVGDQRFHAPNISWMSDALGDLVRAALAITVGSPSAEVRMDGEPIETRVICRREYRNGEGWDEHLRLIVLELPSFFEDLPEEHGTERLSAIIPADAFADAILREAMRISSEIGVEEYERRWEFSPYPHRGVAALRAALAR